MTTTTAQNNGPKIQGISARSAIRSLAADEISIDDADASEALYGFASDNTAWADGDEAEIAILDWVADVFAWVHEQRTIAANTNADRTN